MVVLVLLFFISSFTTLGIKGIILSYVNYLYEFNLQIPLNFLLIPSLTYILGVSQLSSIQILSNSVLNLAFLSLARLVKMYWVQDFRRKNEESKKLFIYFSQCHMCARLYSKNKNNNIQDHVVHKIKKVNLFFYQSTSPTHSLFPH